MITGVTSATIATSVATYQRTAPSLRAGQRNTQSVPELIGFLNELEYQLDPPFEDRVRRMFLLFNALHPHLRRGIVEQNRPWPTRDALEEAATSLETVVIPPEGIRIKKAGQWF